MTLINKPCVFFTILLFSSFCFKAQTYDSQNKKAIKLYQSAESYFDMKDFTKCISTLKKAIEEDPKFTDAYSLLGQTYADQSNFEKAAEYLKKAIEINPDFSPINFYQLGLITFRLERYEEAHLYLSELLTKNIHPSLKTKAEGYLKNATFAKEAIKNPVDFDPQNLGPSINSEHHEYFPSITADDQILLYTRRLPSRNGYQEDFFVSFRDKENDQKWKPAFQMRPPINTNANEGAPCISADGKRIFFTVCESYGSYGEYREGLGSCDIFLSEISGGAWGAPVNLGESINSNYWESQPSFSSDGKTLYFVKRVKKNGKTEQDIFTSTLLADQTWSKAQALSGVINTHQREESVFIHPDNQTLYFSSEGHPGFGGLDIFKSTKNADDTWSTPVNLGYPINSSKDENSLLVSANGTLAYFASDRAQGLGGFDIYSFELDKSLRPIPVTYAKGMVYDASNKKPLEAAFELIDLETKSIVVSSVSDSKNGRFLVSLPTHKSYALNVSKKGYMFHSENFSFEGLKNGEPYVLKIPLQRIEVDRAVVLKNIFFETAKYDLQPTSEAELQKLNLFLKQNPNVHIEISGHTDNVGDKQNNQTLSDQRAKAVYNYLIERKIEASRLSFKGYADQKPITENTNEEGRAQNRRTEFKIIKK